MNEIKVIECDFSDQLHIQKLVELINCYISDTMGGGEIISGNKTNDLINGLKSHPSKLILFALYKNEFAGLTNCFINFGTFAAKPFINIHDIIVDNNFRGKGIGRTLMDAIVQKAKALDCSKITLEVREDNVIAQKLYKSLGFGDTNPKMYFWTRYL
jgi:ribosomal protein S18 acetylase RimI-like enzyme